jgi:hypothetical protein
MCHAGWSTQYTDVLVLDDNSAINSIRPATKHGALTRVALLITGRTIDPEFDKSGLEKFLDPDAQVFFRMRPVRRRPRPPGQRGSGACDARWKPSTDVVLRA